MSGLKNSLANLYRSFTFPSRRLLHEQFAYGHREIYLRNFNFDFQTLFLAEVQHGWYFSTEWTAQSKRGSRIKSKSLKTYPLLLWSGQLANEFVAKGHKDVFAVTSPWRLLHDSYFEQLNSNHKKTFQTLSNSALYFPRHSFPGFEMNIVQAKTIEQLRSANFAKLSTSLFWLDFIDPKVHNIYSEFSEVICMGFRQSSSIDLPWQDIGGRVNFLYRLFKTIYEHEYIICDEISTASMAALSLGKKVILTKSKKSLSNLGRNSSEVLSFNEEDILRPFKAIESDFGFGLELSSIAELYEICRERFGFNISRERSFEILSKLSFIDKDLQTQAQSQLYPWKNCDW